MEVRLLPATFTEVSEGETFPICAELTSGTVGCYSNVFVALDVKSDNAIGEVETVVICDCGSVNSRSRTMR